MTDRKELQYGDKMIRMEGVIVEIHEGCVGIDLKGRLGFLKIPMRMLITEYPLKVGQEVAWNMSFVEQLGPKANEKYVSNLDTYSRHRKEMEEKMKKEVDRGEFNDGKRNTVRNFCSNYSAASLDAGKERAERNVHCTCYSGGRTL